MNENNFGQLIREIAAKQGVTQVELAMKSNVSRVQINRIFSGNTVSIRAETRHRLLDALGLDEAAIESADALVGYRKKIHERYLVKSLAGLGFAEIQKQPLNTFYVAPVGELHTFRSCRMESRAQLSAEPPKNGEPTSAVDAVMAYQRLVILGMPGTGKTTFLQYLATESAQGNLGKSDLPLFVRLPEFALAIQEQPDLGIFDWIVSQTESMECTGIVQPLARQLRETHGSVLSLFDGLDEVPGQDGGESKYNRGSNTRGRVIQAICEFISLYPNQKVVVTSRLTGFDEAPWSECGFQKLELQEYGEDQIREAVSKWSTILSNSKQEPASKISLELTEAIFQNQRVKLLAGNPLILTILILMCKARGYALPRRRVDLYEKVAEVFLDSWEASKRKEHGFRETRNIDLDTRELKWLVAELALSMQKAGLFSAHRWWIIDHIRMTLCSLLGFDNDTAKRQSDPILRFISARAGLIDERMPNVFAFTHRTMQEFFAAIGLIEAAQLHSTASSLPQLVYPYLYHPEWSEVVRLTVAQVSPSPAEDLMKVIVDDRDPTGLFLRRGKLLAIKCLADGATVSDRRFVQDIFDSFKDLGDSRWLGLTFEVFSALRLLNGTRYEQAAIETKNAILRSAKELLPHDDYESLVFNAEGPRPLKLKANSDESEAPIIRREIQARELIQEQYFPNIAFFLKDPKAWHTLASKWLGRKDLQRNAKEAIIWFMTYPFDGDTDHVQKTRVQLERVLTTDMNREVRALAATALGVLPPDDNSRVALSDRLLHKTESDEVRSACAVALESAAEDDAKIRVMLIRRLQDKADSERVRASAASGLEASVELSNEVEDALLAVAESDSSKAVQVACVFSLAPVCNKHKQTYERWIEETSVRTIPAAKVLADAYSSDRFDWDERAVKRIESVLIRAGTAQLSSHPPCGYILAAIENLLIARERRCGLKLETTIAEKLRPHSNKVQLAFFCPMGNDKKAQEEDIDLFLIGSVTRFDITESINQIESVVGRHVNPIVYSMAEFCSAYKKNDSTLTEVAHRHKVFIAVGNSSNPEKDLNDALGITVTQGTSIA